jgi:hypothetical protein
VDLNPIYTELVNEQRARTLTVPGESETDAAREPALVDAG